MDTTRHTINVFGILTDGEEVNLGDVTVHGRSFAFTDAEALDAVLPEGDAPTRLDFESVPGFVRFGATIIPADRFRRLTATIVAASRPNTPEEQAAVDAAREAREA